MSFSATSSGYPNSFCSTYVTYDMRLIGSFHTSTTHGRSGSTSVSPTGWSVSTGATCSGGPAIGMIPLSRARCRAIDAWSRSLVVSAQRVGQHTVTGAGGSGSGLRQRQPHPQDRDPHQRTAEHVDPHQEGRHAGEVLPVADRGLGDQHDEQLAQAFLDPGGGIA